MYYCIRMIWSGASIDVVVIFGEISTTTQNFGKEHLFYGATTQILMAVMKMSKMIAVFFFFEGLYF